MLALSHFLMMFYITESLSISETGKKITNLY